MSETYGSRSASQPVAVARPSRVVRVAKRARRRDRGEIDLRTPSGRRLPY